MLLVLALGGCAGAGQNVRALRQYQREEVTPELLSEHLQELDDTLELIDKLLHAPYHPGEPWVLRLPLKNEAELARARELVVAAGALEKTPSLLKAYQRHVRDLLEAAADDEARRAAAAAANAVPALPAPPVPVPGVTPAPEGTASPGAEPGNDEAPPAEPAPGDVEARAGSASEAPQPPAPPAPAPAPPPAAPEYGSVLQALAGLDPALAGVDQRFAAAREQARALGEAQAELERLKSAEHRSELAIQQERARIDSIRQALAVQSKTLLPVLDPRLLSTAEGRAILRDAVTISSVALRMALEAVSLATVATLEAGTLLAKPEAMTRDASGMLALVTSAPAHIQNIGARLEGDAEALRDLVGSLARVQHIDPDATPGYALRDGLVDEVVGLTWESIHVNANAGGEALFYDSLADAEKSSGSGASYDYTGRVYKLVYHVDPIVLAAANVSASMDWTRLAEAAGLKLRFATNRVYKSGGDIEQSTLAHELGVTSAWSDALDAVLSIAGVHASARLAHFTSGTVDLVQVADGSVVESAPFGFTLREIKAGYDFARQAGPMWKSVTLTLGYFDYTLPRVLYELDNTTPGTDTATYVYSRESPPQAVRTRLAVLGFGAQGEHPLGHGFRGVFGLNLAVGAGPMSYYFLKDYSVPDEAANRERTNRTTFGLNGGLYGGVRWIFAGSDGRLNAHFDAIYQAQLIVPQLGSNSSDSKTVNSGSSDLFHGPVASLGGSF